MLATYQNIALGIIAKRRLRRGVNLLLFVVPFILPGLTREKAYHKTPLI